MKNLLISLVYLVSNSISAFEINQHETVVLMKTCSVDPCVNARITYRIRDNKVFSKRELLDEKGKVLKAEIEIFDDCAILDEKNWTCGLNVKSYAPHLVFSLVNGKYFPQSNSKIQYKQIQ